MPFVCPTGPVRILFPCLGILVLQPHDKAAMLVVYWWSIQQNFSRRIYMEIGFSPQRRETLLFFTTNIPPTWPLWHDVQTSNSGGNEGLRAPICCFKDPA